MKRAIVKLELVFPYKLSMSILAEFCNLWDCTLLEGGTKKIEATISMPKTHFKKIFGQKPIKKEYPVPRGMEKFISKLIVKRIK